MAVVILMLPAAGDPAHPGSGALPTSGGAPLTYRLSLAPGAESATIELEGRPPVKAPVQRVYPSPSPPISPSSLALLRSVPAASPARTPPGAVTAATATGAPPSRMNRRAFPTATRPTLSPDQIEYTSANGAPIIE